MQHSRGRRASTALAGVLVGSLLTAPALAGEPDPKAAASAQVNINAAAGLFKLGNYSEAAEGFERAAKKLEDGGHQLPTALHRALARCYDQLGRTVESLERYDLFLKASDESNDQADVVKQAREARARIRGLLDRTRLSFDVQPVGTKVLIDGEPVGAIPLEPVKVKPGPHEVTLSADGFEPATLTVEVIAGATIPVKRLLDKPSPAPPEAAPEVASPGSDTAAAAVADPPVDSPQTKGTGAGWPTWLTLGTGAALLVGGAMFGQLSGAALDERDALKGTPSAFSTYQDHDDTARSRALTANVLYTSGALMAVAGLVMLWTNDTEP